MSQDQPETTEEIVVDNPSSDNGCWRSCSIVTIIIVVLFSCVIIFTLLFARDTVSQFFGNLANLFSSAPTSARIDTQRTLINSIQPLGQLVTISTEIAKADIFVNIESGGLNLCGHSAQHVAQGVIEAGVDFTAITTDSINYSEETDTFTISMPYPQITSCRIEYIRQYDTKSNFGCSPNWDSVRLLAQYVATNEFATDALDAGILERAQTENTILMQAFINALTSSNVEILYDIDDTTSVNLPNSCQPETPQGWRFDEELQQWFAQ